jgi:hypothetical protein
MSEIATEPRVVCPYCNQSVKMQQDTRFPDQLELKPHLRPSLRKTCEGSRMLIGSRLVSP